MRSDRRVPEAVHTIVFQEAYISRIIELTVLIRGHDMHNEMKIHPWEALVDGREWPALSSLRVVGGDDHHMTPFQLNISAPVLVNIRLYRVSARSWKSLGLGSQTRVVEWVHDKPDDEAAISFYSILPRLAHLTALCTRSTSELVSLDALVRAAPVWDKLTVMELNMLDATIQDIEAVLGLGPHLTRCLLSFQNKITGSYVVSHLSDQRGGRRMKLEELTIDHNIARKLTSPSCHPSIIELVEDALDLSTLRILSLNQLAIGRSSPLPSRCTALVKIHLFAVAVEPTFIVDLEHCQHLETLVMEVIWDFVEETPSSALPAVDHLAPLPRLRSAQLFSYSSSGIYFISETAAAVCGSEAFARLGRNSSKDLTMQACSFTSTTALQQLLPQLALHGVHISVNAGPFSDNRLLLDVHVSGIPANVGVGALSPRQHWEYMITRSFVLDQASLAGLFEAVKLWMDYPSQVETISIHSGIADRVPLVVQDAMELLRGSRFESCDDQGYCSHFCRSGTVLSRAG